MAAGSEDVIGRRGTYGRLGQRWFSRGGWAMNQKRTLGMSSDDSRGAGPNGAEEGISNQGVRKVFPTADDGASARDAALSMLPRLLRSAEILFGTSRTFYFSYDRDITRTMANPKSATTPLVPLYDHVDATFFWNRHIIRPFIDAGMDALVLPLMQGFVGQRSFTVDSQPLRREQITENDLGTSQLSSENDAEPIVGFGSPRASPPSNKGSFEAAAEQMRPTEKRFDITVISRRSTKRAGLRYLRRGVDEDGNVANFVESEQILSPAKGASAPAGSGTDPAGDGNTLRYSFVQTRGSFPLFFTQSPYSLKPAPVIQHSAAANFAAFRKHFHQLQDRYGTVHAVSLVEKHGVEAVIGEMYEKSVTRLNEEMWPEAVDFEWFDFHAACRGMKFENVALLLQTAGPKLDSHGSTVAAMDKDGNERELRRQTGVLRTNCMDCLDRTNVCQSYFARHMLDAQLGEQGFDMSAQLDQENAWFNTLWADNGDAISKQYASTGAMKGDYTRTRKRDYRGALTDAGLSISRMFNG